MFQILTETLIALLENRLLVQKRFQWPLASFQPAPETYKNIIHDTIAFPMEMDIGLDTSVYTYVCIYMPIHKDKGQRKAKSFHVMTSSYI